MLRSPLTALGEWRTRVVLNFLGLGAMIWLVAASLTMVVQVESAGTQWWEGYQPVVYLDGVSGDEVAAALGEEIEAWRSGAKVNVEGREIVLERVVQDLGSEKVRKMGLSEEMMPLVLLVEMDMWGAGREEFIARLEALEVRDEVIGVEVPGADALSWINQGRGVFAGFGVVMVLLLLGVLGGMGSFLRQIQAGERRENHLLEVFGASPGGLVRASVVRGIVLGGGAGTMAALGFVPWVLVLEGFVDHFGTTAVVSAGQAALLGAGLIPAGMALGALVGLWSARPGGSGRQMSAMESLLEWESEP